MRKLTERATLARPCRCSVQQRHILAKMTALEARVDVALAALRHPNPSPLPGKQAVAITGLPPDEPANHYELCQWRDDTGDDDRDSTIVLNREEYVRIRMLLADLRGDTLSEAPDA